MARAPLRVLATSLLAFVVGYALWPPRHVYWLPVAAVVGEGVTLAFIAFLAVVAGTGVATVLEYSVEEFVVGGLVAYAVGMALVEAVFETDSPVHFLLYGGLFLCYGLGVAIGASRR
ncbi:hypothetical protein ACFR99_14880 [Haloarchaeobius amylolyticus]|uniref:Uncharacterized protein n=1 Tax=Haloarchaeobius amylolyticus TaxID=1198296 RepID=A0ABD6BIL7_9EURY